MTVELTDEDGKTIRPADEPLWRGVTMLRTTRAAGIASRNPPRSVVSFHPSRSRVRAR